jgi:hypothetical protein
MRWLLAVSAENPNSSTGSVGTSSRQLRGGSGAGGPWVAVGAVGRTAPAGWLR